MNCLNRIPHALNAAFKNSKIFSSANLVKLLNYETHRSIVTSTQLKTSVSFFIEIPSGERFRVESEKGLILRDAIYDSNHLGEGYGACGATMCCSTCYVNLPEDIYDQLKSSITDDEIDTVEMAAESITGKSRLACALLVTPILEGRVIEVPIKKIDVRHLPVEAKKTQSN